MDVRQVSSLAGLLMFASLSFAKTNDPCCGIKIFGYIDGSYNHLDSSPQFVSGVDDREFDIEENGFTLHQISLTTAYQPEIGFGGLFNAIFGRDAQKLAPFGYNPDIGHRDVGVTPYQLFAQYASKSYTFLFGNFASLAGFEGTDTSSNSNFSRSLLSTFTQPSTHLGLRGTYVYSDKFKWIIGINNGWDNIRDFSRDKTLELGIIYNPTETFSFQADGYFGQERVNFSTATGPIGMRSLLDIFLSYQVSKKVTLVLNGDYGAQTNIVFASGRTGSADWFGLATYLNYKLNNKWRFSIRAEGFNDKDGYTTGVSQTLKELTFTLGFIPFKNIEMRAETRRDFSNQFSYIDIDSLNLRKTQQSYGLEAVYTFNNNVT